MDTSLTEEEKEFLLRDTDVDDEDEDGEEEDEEGMTFRLLLKGVYPEDYNEIVNLLDSLGVDYEEL